MKHAGRLHPTAVVKLQQAGKGSAPRSKPIALLYVSYETQGISRIKKGRHFSYHYKGGLVKDNKRLARIKSLVIPPAWKNVWICAQENGHLQCTGIDVKGRKQYRYHPLWNQLRKQKKFHQLLQFGALLPDLRKKIAYRLSKNELTKDKVLAAMVSVMDKTGMRVGNSLYEKLYGSFGLSTLKDRHITIKKNQLSFTFKGKKGIYQQVSLKSARLANTIRKCKEIPGKELFQYLDESGTRHCIRSEEVNEFIKSLCGAAFTSKDFRTWVGTTECVRAFVGVDTYASPEEMKKNTVSVLNQVATTLGNTVTVCKNHYIHPVIIALYEQNKLQHYLKNLSGAAPQHQIEKALLSILKSETKPKNAATAIHVA